MCNLTIYNSFVWNISSYFCFCCGLILVEYPGTLCIKVTESNLHLPFVLYMFNCCVFPVHYPKCIETC